MGDSLSAQLVSYLDEDTVIVCVGTDKCIADCLGPIVGSILKEKEIDIPIYGTLDNPIHALNMHEQLNFIKNKHPNAKIIGVDACLGIEEEIGMIRIRDYAIHPGKGVGKELPEVGIASIIGIVDSNPEILFSRCIRLSFVMAMAKQIVEIIIKAIKDTGK